MRSANTLNKTILSNTLFFMLLVFLIMSGCKNGPFSPEAKIIISSFDSQTIAPSYSEGDSNEAVVLPEATVTLRLLQGTGVFIEGYTVDYYRSTDEVEITAADGSSLHSSGKITSYLTDDADLTLTVPVYDFDVYEVIHKGTTPGNTATDLTPIYAVLKFYGHDANSNFVSATGYVTLTTIGATRTEG